MVFVKRDRNKIYDLPLTQTRLSPSLINDLNRQPYTNDAQSLYQRWCGRRIELFSFGQLFLQTLNSCGSSDVVRVGNLVGEKKDGNGRTKILRWMSCPTRLDPVRNRKVSGALWEVASITSQEVSRNGHRGQQRQGKAAAEMDGYSSAEYEVSEDEGGRCIGSCIIAKKNTLCRPQRLAIKIHTSHRFTHRTEDWWIDVFGFLESSSIFC